MHQNVVVVQAPVFNPEGKASVTVRFTNGNKGEADVTRDVTIERSWSKDDFIEQMRALARPLNAAESYLDTVTAGLSISLVRPADPLAANQQNYRTKAAELHFIRQLLADGVVDATATSRAATLVTQLQNAGYATVFP